MIRIKVFRPSCISGLDIHVCKEEKATTPLPDIQGVPISVCMLCGQEAGRFVSRDGRIEYIPE